MNRTIEQMDPSIQQTDQNIQQITGRQLRDLFHPIYADQRLRTVKTLHPNVLNLGSRPRDPELLDILNRTEFSAVDITEDIKEAFSDIAETPTVTLFLTRKGSGRLAEVHSALRDPQAARELQKRFITEGEHRQEKSMAEAIQELVGQPVYAEFLYANLRIAEHLYVPDDRDLIAFVFPYDGGRLAPDSFSLVQWSKNGGELEALVVHNAPPITDVERQAERSQEPARVYHARICDTTWWGVVGAVALFTAGAAAAAGPNPGGFDIADLGDDVLDRLSGSPSVGELIAIRIDALSKE